jgi:hypothetical protein
MLDKWQNKAGATIGSTTRALLYLPVEHSDSMVRSFADNYRFPLVRQDIDQSCLPEPSWVNTERMFEIEKKNIRTFRLNACRYSTRGRRVSNRRFSLSLEALVDITKWLLDTPTLRAYKHLVDGKGRPELPIYRLSRRGIIQLSRYVVEPERKDGFDAGR